MPVDRHGIGAELAGRHVDLEGREIVAQHQRHAVVLAHAQGGEPARAAGGIGLDVGPAPETLARRHARRHFFFPLPPCPILAPAPFSMVRPRKLRQRPVVRPMRQHARLVKHDDAMDRRPHRPAEQFRIDIDDARRRHLLGTARDVARRPLGLRSKLGMLFVNRRIDLEHDAIGVRILEREGEIGLARQPPALGRVGDAGGSLLERIGELAEGLGAHRRQDVGLVLEIAIGRLGAAAQRLGELAHGDALIAEAGETLGRDLAQFGAEVGDVLVGEITRHGFDTQCVSKLSRRQSKQSRAAKRRRRASRTSSARRSRRTVRGRSACGGSRWCRRRSRRAWRRAAGGRSDSR